MSMKASHLLILLAEAKLSPEELGTRLGISGMTIRRWTVMDKNKDIPHRHISNIIEGLHQLILEGRLQADSKVMNQILQGYRPRSFDAAMKNLGASPLDVSSENNQNQMVKFLVEIGMNGTHKSFVEMNQKKVESFEKGGKEWSVKIRKLLKIIRLRELALVEKCIAFGALFYLITPFDLIPDHIPVIGLLDDFGIISLAVGYYATRYPQLCRTSE